MRKSIRFLVSFTLAGALSAQVYSPKLLREGQPDPTDLKKFAEGIYARADARTPREKAEAIWRFFLTDGRFVKPGFWYHIAGWTYEEPSGEVLDPLKLLNSYGFGLCYHIAPLLGAVFEAGGFPEARSWFLTGHTVTEVFYNGGYHYFDSDMMGYNVTGDGPFQGKPVVGVRDLERDPSIILGKLKSPREVKPGTVDNPWYPADVRAAAMDGLAGLFSSTSDNYLYPYTRYSSGHQMDFVLRPGEKLIRFFRPEETRLFYLPYKFDGTRWSEFPQEIAEYHIRTEDGPRSQKDNRTWATGRIEYTPPSMGNRPVTIISMPSPYVIIDAHFTMNAELASSKTALRVETSTNGETWDLAGELRGPHQGAWYVEPRVVTRSEHGRLTAVSGSYGYRARITKSPGARVTSLQLVSRIQLNPRTLPAIRPGENTFVYSSAAPVERITIPAPLARAPVHDLEFIEEKGQGLLRPRSGCDGEATYVLEAGGRTLEGFGGGARFLDLRNTGLAPDKLTAETRHTAITTANGPASLAWSISPNGPFHELWSYPQKFQWRDGKPVHRLLLWPEVFRQVHELPAGTRRVYVRFRSAGPAIDSIRLAVYAAAPSPAGQLQITQVWREGGVRHQHVERINARAGEDRFNIRAGADVENEAVIFSSPGGR